MCKHSLTCRLYFCGRLINMCNDVSCGVCLMAEVSPADAEVYMQDT